MSNVRVDTLQIIKQRFVDCMGKLDRESSSIQDCVAKLANDVHPGKRNGKQVQLRVRGAPCVRKADVDSVSRCLDDIQNVLCGLRRFAWPTRGRRLRDGSEKQTNHEVHQSPDAFSRHLIKPLTSRVDDAIEERCSLSMYATPSQHSLSRKEKQMGVSRMHCFAVTQW